MCSFACVLVCLPFGLFGESLRLLVCIACVFVSLVRSVCVSGCSLGRLLKCLFGLVGLCGGLRV